MQITRRENIDMRSQKKEATRFIGPYMSVWFLLREKWEATGEFQVEL